MSDASDDDFDPIFDLDEAPDPEDQNFSLETSVNFALTDFVPVYADTALGDDGDPPLIGIRFDDQAARKSWQLTKAQKQNVYEQLVNLGAMNGYDAERLENDATHAISFDLAALAMLKVDLLIDSLLPAGTSERLRYDYNWQVVLRAQIDQAKEEQLQAKFGLQQVPAKRLIL